MADINAEKKHNYATIPDPDAQEKQKQGCCNRYFPNGYFSELKEVIKLLVPMIFTQLLQFLIGPVALMFCGHLGEIELGAVALAISFINITGISIALGLGSACDTLFAQVYGSTNRRRMGIELQRSIFILLLAVLPCWSIHINIEAVLRLLGQDPMVARRTAEYLLVFMPGVPIYFLYTALSKYIQTQNIMIPNMVIGAIANGMNALLHYLLVIVADLGLEGSAISQVLAYFTMLLLTFIYIFFWNISKETWSGWSWECLHGWGEFCRLAVFGLAMFCIEFWSFEGGIIGAGLISTAYLGAMSVIYQLTALAYMLPMGTGIVASIRVGQFLGAGNADGAKTSARVLMTSILIAEAGVAIIFLTCREYLPLLFTNVDAVIEHVKPVLYLSAIYQLPDGLATVGAGIMRGQGRQNLGAAIVASNLGLGACIGIPLMVFTFLRLFAFWGALAIGLIIEAIILSLVINLNDWNKLVHEAQLRTGVVSEAESLPVSNEASEKLPLVSPINKPSDSQIDQEEHVLSSSSDSDSLFGNKPVSQSLVIKRILAAALMLSIFIGAIFLRVFYTNYLDLPVELLSHPSIENSTFIPTT